MRNRRKLGKHVRTTSDWHLCSREQGRLCRRLSRNGYPDSAVIKTLVSEAFPCGFRRGKIVHQKIPILQCLVKHNQIIPYRLNRLVTLKCQCYCFYFSNGKPFSSKSDEQTRVITAHRPGIFAVTEAWQVERDTVCITYSLIFASTIKIMCITYSLIFAQTSTVVV